MKTSFIVPAAVLAAVASVNAQDSLADLLAGGNLLCAYAAQDGVAAVESTFFANPQQPTAECAGAFPSLSATALNTTLGTCGSAFSTILSQFEGEEGLELPELELDPISTIIALNEPLTKLVKTDLYKQIIFDWQCLIPKPLVDILLGLRLCVTNDEAATAASCLTGLIDLSGDFGLDGLLTAGANCTVPIPGSVESEYAGHHITLLQTLLTPETDAPTTEAPTTEAPETDPPVEVRRLATLARNLMDEVAQVESPLTNKMLLFVVGLLTSEDFAAGASGLATALAQAITGYVAAPAEQKTAVVQAFMDGVGDVTCPCDTLDNILAPPYGIDSLAMRYLNHPQFIEVWGILFDMINAGVNSLVATAGSEKFEQTCQLKLPAAGISQALGVCKTAVEPMFADLAAAMFTTELGACFPAFCGARPVVPLFLGSEYTIAAVPGQVGDGEELELDNVNTLFTTLGDNVFGEVAGVMDNLVTQCARTVAPVTEEPTNGATSTNAASVASVAVAVAAILFVRDN